MEDRRYQSLRMIINNLTHASLKMVRDITKLFTLESKLAKKSLINIVILSFLLRAFLTMTWVGICAILVLLLVALNFTWLAAFAFVTLLNLIIVIAVGLIINHLKKNLKFSATRRQLKNMKGLIKDT